MKLNILFYDDCWFFFKNIKVLEKKLNKKEKRILRIIKSSWHWIWPDD